MHQYPFVGGLWVRGWVGMGGLTGYCTPLKVQRAHDRVFRDKNRVRTKRLRLLVYVPTGTYCCTVE